jgi:hypothetical protein
MVSLFAPGDPLETLEFLDELGVTVVLDDVSGELRARPVPVSALGRELITSNRALLHAVLHGASTGHEWARCDFCGEGRMVQSGRAARCAMTPGCEGSHDARQKEMSR